MQIGTSAAPPPRKMGAGKAMDEGGGETVKGNGCYQAQKVCAIVFKSPIKGDGVVG